MVPVVDLTAERFDELVAEALDGLPEWVRERLDNVDVIVVDRPPPGQPTLLGLYQGIPLTHRGSNYFGVLPDRITLCPPWPCLSTPPGAVTPGAAIMAAISTLMTTSR